MTCTQCGYLLDGFEEACPRCGAVAPPRPRRRATDRMPLLEIDDVDDSNPAAAREPRKRAIDIGNVLPEHISLDQALKLLLPRTAEVAAPASGKEILDLDRAAPETLERGGKTEAVPGLVWTGPERRAPGCPGCGNPRQRHIMDIHIEAGPDAALQLDAQSQALLNNEFGTSLARQAEGIDLGGAFAHSEAELQLARQLAPPHPPRYEPAFMTRVAWGITILGLFALIRLHPTERTVILCLIVLGGTIAMAAIETAGRHRAFEQAEEAWRASCRRWRDTFYCDRCEIVYNQTTGQRAGVESLLKIL